MRLQQQNLRFVLIVPPIAMHAQGLMFLQFLAAIARWLVFSTGRWLCLTLLGLGLSLMAHSFVVANPTGVVQPPLSTRGADIIDAKGQSVLLRGVNWFGIETELHVPHGLWQRDYKDMLAQIKGLGYNLIRLPYAVQSLRSTTISGVDFSIGSNRDLEGKTPLEVMDQVIQEAQRQGLMILLDSHRLNNQRIPELWYGDGFTEADWIDTWKLLAERYKNQPNVIGADLKNEPHGRASWGTNDLATDWRLAAERAGNAILKINPQWLIVVEGVEKNVPGQRLQHWWGGNLEGVRQFPVRLTLKNKLVYSPHEYGAGVTDQPWFNVPAFPNNLRDRWEIGFHYIARQKIAPILIGEFGGRQVDAVSKEGIWQRQLVRFIQEKKLNFAYWSWNPNSDDTGGILQADWRSLETEKQALLNTLLPVATMAVQNSVAIAPSSPTAPPPARPTAPPPRPSSTPALPPDPKTDKRLALSSRIQSDWQTGFCTEIVLKNLTPQIQRGQWRVAFTMGQAEIRQSWNGDFARQGTRYVVTLPSWAQTIYPQQAIHMGFCADKRGPNYQPQQVELL